MKRTLTMSLALISAILLSTPVFAECKINEGEIYEYDFTLDGDRNDVIRPFAAPRVVATDCRVGQNNKTTFRGVTAEFKNEGQIRKAIEAAEILASIGFIDSAAIKQLVDRVVALKAAEAARRKPKVEDSKPIAAAKQDSQSYPQNIWGIDPKKK